MQSFTIPDTIYKRRWRSRNIEKAKAQALVSCAIRKGKINPPNKCSNCGQNTRPIEAHHEDYSKPFQITWLCKICHRKLHLSKLSGLVIEHVSEERIKALLEKLFNLKQVMPVIYIADHTDVSVTSIHNFMKLSKTGRQMLTITFEKLERDINILYSKFEKRQKRIKAIKEKSNYKQAKGESK